MSVNLTTTTRSPAARLTTVVSPTSCTKSSMPWRRDSPGGNSEVSDMLTSAVVLEPAAVLQATLYYEPPALAMGPRDAATTLSSSNVER